MAMGVDVATAEASSATLSFVPVADVSASSALPDRSYGTSSRLEVDGNPVKQAFLKFSISGLGDAAITGVRLRMYQVDASSTGGYVHAMSGIDWSESLTWNTRPSIDGSQVGSFGSVGSGTWYEADLDRSLVTGDGTIAIAIDTPDGNGADWGTRESPNTPQLLVTVEAPSPSQSSSELLTLAAATEGSSDPTFYGSNRRVAETASGRILAVHGRHATGVQLAWKDAGSSWLRTTQGSVADGLLLRGTGTGDWPASIAAFTAPDGTEHAWVAWSGTMLGSEPARPLQLVHLTNLADPAGPRVGPTVTVVQPGLGNGRADLGFERAADGSVSGYVTWVRRVGEGIEETAVTSFANVTSDSPEFSTPVALSTDSTTMAATVVETPVGVRIAGRSTGGKLTLWRHGTDPATWTAASVGMTLPTKARPAAAGLTDGTVVSVADRDIGNQIVSVQRFSPSGAASTIELNATGYRQPTITTDGSLVWIVMVRAADGFVVSRLLSNGAWGPDVVEIGAEGGGNHSWPNASGRSTTRLNLVVRGPRGSTTNSATTVLGYQRLL
jgi:hypothetical protein